MLYYVWNEIENICVPGIQTLDTRSYMVYRWRCRWNDNKKTYLIFVLPLLLIALALFSRRFLLVARKIIKMWYSTAAEAVAVAAAQYLFFDVNILLRVQQS